MFDKTLSERFSQARWTIPSSKFSKSHLRFQSQSGLKAYLPTRIFTRVKHFPSSSSEEIFPAKKTFTPTTQPAHPGTPQSKNYKPKLMKAVPSAERRGKCSYFAK